MILSSSGVYNYTIALGETRVEQFHLALDPNGEELIHPCVHKADQNSRVEGPDDSQNGCKFQIDGWRDMAAEGSLYEITFQRKGKRKNVAWKVVTKVEDFSKGVYSQQDMAMALKIARSKHVYSLAMESKNWAFLDMQPDTKDASLWTCTTPMCLSGKDEFVVVRDHDRQQTIYPSKGKNWDTSVPLMGPSDGNCGRAWAFHSPPLSPVTFELRVISGIITLMVTTSVDGKKVWSSAHQGDSAGHTYSITGSFNDWGMTEMVDMVGSCDDETYRCELPFAWSDKQEFQIVVDRDFGRTYYPQMKSAVPGHSILSGPDHSAMGRAWCVYGSPHEILEVKLDLRAEDRRKAVSIQRTPRISPFGDVCE